MSHIYWTDNRRRMGAVLILGGFVGAADVSAAQCVDGLCPLGSQTQRAAGSTASLVPMRRVGASHAAVCRIVNRVGEGQSCGSGTLVDVAAGRGLVLTCAHLLREGTGQVTVRFQQGAPLPARVVELDHRYDLAALSIPRPAIGVARVAALRPAADVWACGYGQTGRYLCARGQVIGFASRLGTRNCSARIRTMVRSGDSGGGVFDARGALVAVIWGCRDGVTYATCGVPLSAFLDRIHRPRGSLTPPSTALPAKPPRNQSLPPTTDRDRADVAAGRAADMPSPTPWSRLAQRLTLLEQQRQQTAGPRAADTPRPAADAPHVARPPAVPARTNSDTPAALGARVDTVTRQAAGTSHTISLGTAVAAALGVSTPLGLALVLASRLLRRSAGRRRWRVPSRHCPRPARPIPVAVDSPPLPPRTLTETHYVPYEKSDLAHAYQWASAQVVRKYPGAVETLHTLDSLIQQQLNAEPERKP